MSDTTGPSWDLSTEYPSVDSTEVEQDLEELDRLLSCMEESNKRLDSLAQRVEGLAESERQELIEIARDIFVLSDDAGKLLSDLSVFANCLLSVNSQDDEALALMGRLIPFRVRYREVSKPLKLLLDQAEEPFVSEYLQDKRVEASSFALHHSRSKRHELLSLDEENIVTALGESGIHAWGRLYDQLSGTLRCEVADGDGVRPVGIAEAASLMQSSDDAVREDAWRAINRAWSSHLETCAAALNAIAGWRLEECRRRSHEREVHYLDSAVHANHIERQTLESIIQVAAEFKPLAQRAALAMARAYGKEKFGPWDQRAPAPKQAGVADTIGFDDGVRVVADAYGTVNGEMHEFVQMMADRRWIEGTVGPNKRPGAYCTSFDKTQSPRVYMTYSGSMSDVTILAHELGHAFHHWAMRDLPPSQQTYGMSLAETASTFGETLVREALFKQASSREEKMSVAWEDASAITSFLLNIPTRYTFERNFYDARTERPLRPDELRGLMGQAWIDWHGEALSEPDDLFWVNKLHFYISGVSFYNFPYLLGYLFSQGIYQRRSAMGSKFFSKYVALLRDTGRMPAEELADKHLGVDLTLPDFWQETINALEPRVAQFEELVG